MRLLPALVLIPAVASASGFYLSENGSKALMMGGAFAGQADDMSAIQHNPAGLSQLRGFNFLLDGQLVWHNINFKRIDPGFDPGNPPNTGVNDIQNSAPPFIVPMIGVGYGLKLLDRTLFIGLGVYGPPANGQYQFPKPNYTRGMGGSYEETPLKYAPQRYSLIDNYILIVFPTLSIAMDVIPNRFSLGVSLQPVIGSFHFTQSVTSIRRVFTQPPMRQRDEDPFYDSTVNVNLPMQYLNFTAVFGAMVRATDWLQFGVSFRPQVMLNAKGNLDIQLGEAATALNSTVMGNQTTLSLQLPAELKVGVHVRPISRLGINFDFIYQGWQSVTELVVDPQEVYLKTGMDAPVKVAPFRIQKNWQAAYNFRLGASFALFPWLSLYAGGWYETGAIKDEFLAVDFLNYSRVTFTGGVGVKFLGFEVLLGAAGSPATTKAVTQSNVTAGSTEPDPASVVGTGIYTSSNLMVTLGIRGSFGGRSEEKPKVEEPAPAPAPAPAADPAPAAAPTEAPKS